MTDWSGKYTYNKIAYSGREIHLQGLFRGFSIERMVGKAKEGPYYYFLGNPHDSGAYTSDTKAFYTTLLQSIATRWGNTGSVPIGEINAPGGKTANYRGTSIWNGG
ncbi:hypothetical protein [Methylobacter sp.]|jgi:hypothetical protein|uniref:hypothetical protein n=1 Tax=Methylobacter sp. TaxID=2051955 RepID=UPI003DA4E1E9